jgi:hypothetical protein
VNARCVSGQRIPIWDQVFTMTSVTDGFQLCRAQIRSDAECQCRGFRCRRSRGRNYANYPEALLHGLQKRYGGRHTAKSGTRAHWNEGMEAAVRGLRQAKSMRLPRTRFLVELMWCLRQRSPDTLLLVINLEKRGMPSPSHRTSNQIDARLITNGCIRRRRD